MLSITYSKGIYTLTDGVKTYTFNINNGHLINTKTNKRVCQPTFSKDAMLQALRPHYINNHYNAYANMLTALYHRLNAYTIKETFYANTQILVLLDKLFNVMPKGCILSAIWGLENLSNKQFVKVINFVRDYDNTHDKNINLASITRRIEYEELATVYKLPIEFVEKYSGYLKTLCALGENYRDIALYYFYNQKLYALRSETNTSYSRYCGQDYIVTYIQCCKRMKKQPIKTNNFMREYIETLMAYDIWCETDKNDRFLSHYERYKDNLTFSYGNYVVVLPKDIQDLVTEGNEMHHCVGGYRDKVANGETLVVFIRHKDTPNKCYITAEINPCTGKILQYYLAYDRHISSNEDMEFRQALQVWLLSCKW